ncbi:hypothetical protein [Streptomyces sp. NPDC048242]|uniref:hypothetical protein n=1 Tax=Streptomyces sp. NPDC048242 TaxID=3155026 RepID=UPI00343118C8
MHRDIVDALAQGELRPLRAWLAAHQVETDRLVDLPQRASAVDTEQPPPGDGAADRAEIASAEILAQWSKASAVPGGVPLLLLLVLIAVEAEWNISYHFRPLHDTLAGAARCMRAHGATLDATDRTAARAVVALMDSVAAQIDAENAMITGQLAPHEEAMSTAAASARRAAELARRAADEHPDVSRYIIMRAEEIEVCGLAVARAVRGLRRFLDAGEPLDEVAAEIELAESSDAIASSGYQSELRAHRLALLSLEERRNDPWLRIDRGRITYVYPFAVRRTAPREVVERVGAHGSGWRLGGAAVLSVNNSLNLDDVWNGSDAFNRRYGGALVELPDVAVRGSDGQPLGNLHAEIRFSRLGNHYVRFTADIADVTPAELHSMMLRAAPEFGHVRVSFSGYEGRAWERLAALATDLTEDVCARLAESAETPELPRPEPSPGMFHVIVAVNAASTTQGPARSAPRHETRTARELLAAMGAQVLTSPVTPMVGSLAEWGRYVRESDLIADITGSTGEKLLRTSNTTAIAAPGMAAFTQTTKVTVAEFTASLDGLFAGWSLELVDHYRRVEEFRVRVDAVEREQSGSAAALRALARELDLERTRLNDFSTSVRSTITLIRSPSLVSSPVVADIIRLVLDGSNFRERVTELQALIEDVAQDQLGSSIEKLARRREEREAHEEERRETRQRAKLEVILAVIAAAGMSGVVQVLQAGFFESVKAAAWALASVATILVLAVIVGGFFWPRRD